MIDLLSLNRRVAVEAPGAPLTSIGLSIIRAYNYVAKRVCLHVQELPSVTLTPGDPKIAFTPPSGFSLGAIVSADINGNCLGGVTGRPQCPDGTFGKTYTAPQDIASYCGVPTHLHMVDGLYLVSPCPDSATPYVLTARGQLFVSGSPSQVMLPDAVFSEVEDAVFHRAVSELLAIQDENWSDTRRSAYHARLASFELSNTRANANREYLPGALRASGGSWV